ncbi:MAG TPA: hypothetical protein VHB68_02425 [Steroidobacteraceae bacterium]|nr:hypothetical protein [Steroidobacteraceae bacterium]
MSLLRSRWIDRLTGTLRTVGPYAAVVLLVPGGSLIGLYWAIRRRRSLWPLLRRQLGE